MLSGTPIFDIKPYQPATEAHADARAGFTEAYAGYQLQVDCPQSLLQQIPQPLREGLLQTLALDPRPGYQHDEGREYGVLYAGYNVRFQVREKQLTVIGIKKQ